MPLTADGLAALLRAAPPPTQQRQPRSTQHRPAHTCRRALDDIDDDSGSDGEAAAASAASDAIADASNLRAAGAGALAAVGYDWAAQGAGSARWDELAALLRAPGKGEGEHRAAAERQRLAGWRDALKAQLGATDAAVRALARLTREGDVAKEDEELQTERARLIMRLLGEASPHRCTRYLFEADEAKHADVDEELIQSQNKFDPGAGIDQQDQWETRSPGAGLVAHAAACLARAVSELAWAAGRTRRGELVPGLAARLVRAATSCEWFDADRDAACRALTEVAAGGGVAAGGLGEGDAQAVGLRRVFNHHVVCRLPASFLRAAPPARVMCLDLPSADELWRRAVSRNLPAVIRGAGDRRRALARWRDDAYLLRRAGHCRLRVRCATSADGRTFGHGGAESRRVAAARGDTEGSVASPEGYAWGEATLAEVLGALRDRERPCPYYAARVMLETHARPLLEDAQEPLGFEEAFGAPYDQGVIAYLGPPRTVTPCHYDDSENVLVVVRGSKRVRLFPPGECRRMYPASTGHIYSALPPDLEPESADLPRGFDHYRHARYVDVEVTAGEMLYLPQFWYHRVEGGPGDVNLTLNYWFDSHERKRAAPEVAVPGALLPPVLPSE